MPRTILKTRNGHLDSGDRAAFDKMAERLKSGSAPLLVHIHGGLVDAALGVEIAERLSGIGDTAYKPGSDYEQLYVIWRSGMLETLRTNWPELHKRDRLYRALLGKLLQFIGRKLGISPGGILPGPETIGLDRLEIERRLASEGMNPFADLDAALTESRPAAESLSDAEFEAELERELLSDSALIAASQDIEAALSPVPESLAISGDATNGRETLLRLEKAVVSDLQAETRTALGAEGLGLRVLGKLVVYGVKIGNRVWKRFRSGRDHGLHATIVEEILRELYGDYIGSAIWTLMKDDTAQHFQQRLGTQLLNVLEAAPERKVVLIGHSAGAIFLCHMLQAWVKQGTQRKVDLVFLAPAVRARLFAETLDEAANVIGSFRMFCLGDERERTDALLGERLGALYPSSLLYIVSGLFEDDEQEPHVDAPLLGMERFRTWSGGSLGEAEDAAAEMVNAFLASHSNAEVFSPSNAGPGLNSDARTHGGIDDDEDTIGSVRTFF